MVLFYSRVAGDWVTLNFSNNFRQKTNTFLSPLESFIMQSTNRTATEAEGVLRLHHGGCSALEPAILAYLDEL